MDKMRRDFYTCCESNCGDAQPKQFSHQRFTTSFVIVVIKAVELKSLIANVSAMQSHLIASQHHSKAKSKSQWETKWRKINGVAGLYKYRPSATYFAWVRKNGKQYQESLD